MHFAPLPEAIRTTNASGQGRGRRPLAARLSIQLALVALLALAAAMLAWPGAQTASAATIDVTNTNDSGAGSLRQAIADAVSGDTIEFDLPLPATITLGSQLSISGKTLTIQGPGADQLAIDADGTGRVFDIASGATVTIDALTITGGSLAGAGGGIINNGALTLTNAAVSGNASTNGAGIYNNGVVTLQAVSVTSNHTNNTGHGGGVYNNGTATLENVTVSGNTLNSGSGAGVYSNNTATLRNVTITGNTGFTGGGLWNDGGLVDVTNSIIAGNSASVIGPECLGTITSGGNNLIQDTSDCTISGDTASNITGQDPLLGALEDNGGPTLTHAIGADSPAFDAGADLSGQGITTDQRGVARPQSAAWDMGSYEFGVVVNEDTGADYGTLQAAIDAAGIGHTLLVAAGTLTEDDITVSGGMELTIRGAGAATTAIDADGAGRVFYIDLGATTTIDALTVTGGSLTGQVDEGDYGAGILNYGSLTIINSKITGNHGEFLGGGIRNHDGTLTIIDSTISANTGHEGGGIHHRGTLTVLGSTISGNTATGSSGGGLGGNGTLTIINSTISGNTAGTNGGGLRQFGTETPVIINSTITGNTAAGNGGGISNAPIVTILNTVIAGNTSGTADVHGTLHASSANNLIGDANSAGGLTDGGDGNIVGVDGAGVRDINTILDTALADNGGPTLTHALLPDSLAINAGDDALAVDANDDALTTDQRGAGFPRINGASVDMGAFEFMPVLNEDTGLRYATLQEAIDAAETLSGHTLLVAAGTLTEHSIIVPGTANLTITGAGAGTTVIDGAGAGRVFEIDAGATVVINDLTIANGQGRGAAISNNGSVTVNRSILRDNAADNAGAIDNRNGAVMVINESLLMDNATIGNSGGAIINTGSLEIHNSTLSGNQTTGGNRPGGAIAQFSGTPDPVLIIRNSTITNNTATGDGGGIYIGAGTATLHNTIVAGNTGTTADVFGSLEAASANNLIGDAASAGGLEDGEDGNIVGADVADVLNTTLADNGGPTLTHALAGGSPAIDAGADLSGAPFNITTDQRGVARPQGGAWDIGAVEMGPVINEDTGLDYDTLQEAIDAAETLSGHTLLVAAGTLTEDDINIPGSAVLTIRGAGAETTTIDAAGTGRVFEITHGASVTIDALTVTGGAHANNGGGIRINGGTVTITNSAVAGNTTTNGGGGIFNSSLGTLTVMNSTLSGNTGNGSGGGIFNSSGTTTVINSTISGNTGGDGGGVNNFHGTLTITNSTISGNNAGGGGGVFTDSGAATLHNTIVAGNTAGIDPDVRGTLEPASAHNLIGDAGSAGGLTDGVNGNIVGVDGSGVRDINTILDTTLADNGGPTLTHALLPGSPAINAGDNALAEDADDQALTTDQRGAGFTRIAGGIVDMGAVEFLPVQNEDTALHYATLQEAIDAAETLSGHTLLVAAGTLTEDSIAIGGGTELTIRGAGAGVTAIDAAQAGRVFEIASGASVTIDSLTITGGRTDVGGSAGNGAGIFNEGTLTVTNSSIVGNDAVGGVSSYGGGGIYSEGTLTVSNTSISGNNAGAPSGSGIKWGGGIANFNGTATITASTISGNTGGIGGVSNAGTLTVASSTFDGNESINTNPATASGGAIASAGGTVQITDSVFSGNSSEVPGGAITLDNGTLTVSGSRFSGNTAPSGGTAVDRLIGTLTAENNWWDSMRGPTHADNNGGAVYGEGISGVVDYSPWCGDEDCTVLYGLPSVLAFDGVPAAAIWPSTSAAR